MSVRTKNKDIESKKIKSPPIMVRLDSELYDYVCDEMAIYNNIIKKNNLSGDYSIQDTIRTIIRQHKNGVKP